MKFQLTFNKRRHVFIFFLFFFIGHSKFWLFKYTLEWFRLGRHADLEVNRGFRSPATFRDLRSVRPSTMGLNIYFMAPWKLEKNLKKYFYVKIVTFDTNFPLWSIAFSENFFIRIERSLISDIYNLCPPICGHQRKVKINLVASVLTPQICH